MIRPHLALAVQSLEASIAFYARLLGQPPSKVRPGYANFVLDAPGLHLALNEVDDVRPVTMPEHFGLQVETPAALDGFRTRFTGFPVEVQENVSCCFAVQDKFWATDPDGRRWEVFATLADSDKLAPEDGAACCGDRSEQVREGSACCETDCC